MPHFLILNFKDRSRLKNIQIKSLALLIKEADKPNSADPSNISEPTKKAPPECRSQMV